MSNDMIHKVVAESLSREQLAAEVARLDRAKAKATGKSAWNDRKRAIYAAELDKRGHES